MEASVPPMSAPLCLVHNQDCRLSLNPAALAFLCSVTQPVVVVTIVGPFRTGKSFLMKRLVQKCTGSLLGNAVQTQTKGIWMWCLPHPCKPGVALVLLDTEGLGDPRKADSCNDAWIFTLALLLSSTLVYNSIHTTGHRMLEYLWLLMDLRVRVRAQAVDTEPADEFARVFPGFVWVVRDFMMESSEQPISGDEYLERILRPQLWLTMRKYNELQRRLRNFFPHHKLFMLGQPVADRVLAQMEVLRDDQLQPQFRQQEEAFCQHIWKEAPVKVLLNSSQVTGRVLARLAETYMAAITTGSVPCVESALTVVVEAENSTAVEAAVAEYRQGMEQGLVLPTASHDALMAVHRDWKQRAGTFFLSHAFANTRQCYQALLMDKLEAAKEEFCRRNEEASEQRCCAVLRELWGDTELRMKRGDYVVPGGMRLFQEDLKRVLEEYERRPDKGVKVSRGRGSGCGGNGCASWWYHQAEAVLKEFLRVKGLEMMEMWLDWVDQQCKAVLAEVAAATQTVEKKLEKQLEKQLEEQLEEHRQQQRAELTKMRMVKEKVEQRICILEKQQEAMLAEVAAIKKMVEKQLEQQQVVLAEVTAAKKAVEKQQEQQQVALAEVTALQEAAEAQLEERWQRWAQQLQEEQNLVLSQRLQELEARLQEGRGCEAAALQQMQEEDQTVPSWRSTLLKFLDKVVVPILIRLVNSVVNNAA